MYEVKKLTIKDRIKKYALVVATASTVVGGLGYLAYRIKNSEPSDRITFTIPDNIVVLEGEYGAFVAACREELDIAQENDTPMVFTDGDDVYYLTYMNYHLDTRLGM